MYYKMKCDSMDSNIYTLKVKDSSLSLRTGKSVSIPDENLPFIYEYGISDSTPNEAFENDFSTLFTIEDQIEIPQSARILYLMKRKNN